MHPILWYGIICKIQFGKADFFIILKNADELHDCINS
jgi:hypothetical protein